MLTHLRIQNFKGWKDTGELRLAPITVFFGTNSSGKSSLGQFLMMLQQTAASHDRTRVLHPGDDKTPVDLGTFEDLVHQHDIEHPLKFEFGISQENPVHITDSLHDTKVTGNHIDFKCEVGFKKSKGVRAVCEKFEYHMDSKSEDSSITLSLARKEGKKYKLESEGFNAVRNKGRAWPLPAPLRFFGFPDELNYYYQNTSDLEELSLRLSQFLRNIAYLGPLREEPRRFYAWAGERPENVGTRGERWVSALLAASERRLSLGYKKRTRDFQEFIAEWLINLGLIHSFTVRPMAEGSREYRVRVKVNSGASEVSIPDVGFGVSQVLPVLLQTFYAPKHSTVIMEQPEIHLHPRIQQNLADLFVGALDVREDGEKRNVQFLIESHSEHFLRRLQRRIAEGEIEAKDVAIYFCDFVGKSSRMKPLEVDEYGNIKNWPHNFFGDQMADIAEKQKAAIRRKKEEKGDSDV